MAPQQDKGPKGVKEEGVIVEPQQPDTTEEVEQLDEPAVVVNDMAKQTKTEAGVQSPEKRDKLTILKDDFKFSIHEINNVLTQIVSPIGLLLDIYEDQEFSEVLGTIQEVIDRFNNSIKMDIKPFYSGDLTESVNVSITLLEEVFTKYLLELDRVFALYKDYLDSLIIDAEDKDLISVMQTVPAKVRAEYEKLIGGFYREKMETVKIEEISQ